MARKREDDHERTGGLTMSKYLEDIMIDLEICRGYCVDQMVRKRCGA